MSDWIEKIYVKKVRWQSYRFWSFAFNLFSMLHTALQVQYRRGLLVTAWALFKLSSTY